MVGIGMLIFLFFCSLMVVRNEKRKLGSFVAMALVSVMVLGGCSSSADDSTDEPASTNEVQENSEAQDEEPGSSVGDDEKNKDVSVVDTVDGTLTVHFVDVGQGAAQVIVTPNNKVMVIDGGNNDDEDTMVAYLTDLGIEKVDILIGTHPDADHIGGIDAVIDAFDIGQIYMPNIQSNTQTFESVLQSIANKGLKVTTAKAGIDLNLDSEVTARVIAPIATTNDSNQMSAVVRLQFGDHSFLFTGDAGVEEEQDMVASGETLQSTVMLVGHHGSKHSTSVAFVNAVQPTYAVIQVGKNNYGHPEKEVLSTLTNAGAQILRNDTEGTIIFATDGKNIEVNKNAWEYTGSSPANSSSSDVDAGGANTSNVTTAITATATIDQSNPGQNESVTVTIQVKDSNGNPVSGALVDLNLHYKSTDTQYNASTNANGIATLTFRIGRAAKGYTVNGDISITAGNQTTTTSTAFTPQ